MNENITISLIDDINNTIIKETTITKPNDFADLLLNIINNELIGIPNNFQIFYMKDKNEISLNSNDDYNQLKEKKIYIRKPDPNKIASTICTNKNAFQVNNDNEIKNLKEDISSKNILIEKYKKNIEKFNKLFRNILQKMKEITKLIKSKSNKIDNLIKTLSNDNIYENIDDMNKREY